MNRFIDISGRRFGRLTAYFQSDRKYGKNVLWFCVCDCGEIRLVASQTLRMGRVVSCGCSKREKIKERSLTHGESGRIGIKRSPEYSTWANMHHRCSENAKGSDVWNYVDRGISVCVAWGSYETFLKDMGRRPTRAHEIDRINNDLGYFPENCHWVLKDIQSTNTRRNDRVVYHGVEMVFKRAWESSARVVSYGVAHSRRRRGWDTESAIDNPTVPLSGRRPKGSKYYGALVNGKLVSPP